MRQISICFAFCIFAFLLVGCVTTGPKFAEVAATLPRIETGKTRLIVYRNWGYQAGGLDARVILSSGPELRLPTNTFSYLDINPGRIDISADSAYAPGTSKISVKLKADRTYYIAISSAVDMSKWIWFGAIWAGVVQTADAAVTEVETIVKANSGPYIIAPVSHETAMQRLSQMRLRKPQSP